MFLFTLRKIVSRFLFPVPLSLEFILVGLILLWFTRRQRLGKGLVTFGTVLLLFFSSFPGSNALLRPLERSYPPLGGGSSDKLPAVKYIAVLGGLGDDDPAVAPTSHVFPDLLARLIEAVRLHRRIPGSELVLSGGHLSSGGMAEIAESLGVDPHNIRQLGEPPDTEAESKEMKPIVGTDPFILVTSASHIRRAMGLFEKRGLRPIAAPSDYLVPRRNVDIDDYYPDGYKLFKSQLAIYEYLGYGWAKLTGKV